MSKYTWSNYVYLNVITEDKLMSQDGRTDKKLPQILTLCCGKWDKDVH